MFPMLSSGCKGKEPGGLRNMILLSIVAHLIVITIILISVPTASRHLTFGAVYSVSLVGTDAISSGNKGLSLLKEIEKSGESVSPVLLKKEVSRLATTPTKKEETDRLNVEKAINAIKQKDRDSVRSAGRSNVATGAKIPESEVSGQRKAYISTVWSRIQKNWKLPPSLMPRDNIETIIAVRIARSGGLEVVNFEKRSGNSYFDDAALKAVKKSSPFPPFPSRLNDDSIEIGIRFHPSQFR